MVTASPPARSADAGRARRAGLATTLAVSLALGTLVAADAAAAAESVPFAPTATIAVPAGVSDVSVSGSDLLAFSAAESSLTAIALDDCTETGAGLEPRDCATEWSADLDDESRAWFVDTSTAAQVFVLAQRGADGVITRFDRATGAVIGAPIVVAGHAVRALTFVPVSNTVYVLADDGIVLVDLATGTVTATIAPKVDVVEPVLAAGQQAIIYNSFSTGTGNSTPQGIVYAAYGEYLTTVNVATGTRVETTRRLTTGAAVSQSGVSDPVAGTPSLFVAGTLSTGTYRTFGISSQVVHGRQQNAAYLYNTLVSGSTSTSAVAWVATDPRGLALSTSTDELFVSSAEHNTISLVAAAATGTTAPKALIESISLDTAARTVAGSIDIGGLAITGNADAGLDVYVANPTSRTVTVLERKPLVASAEPTITGDARVGAVLTAETGEWAGGTTFGYEWLADGAPIEGATAATYTVQPGDLGAVISAMVTGGHVDYAPVSRTAAPTSAIVEGVLETGVPTIAGTAVVNGTLTATSGTWTEGTGFGYQWLVDGAPVEGSTAGTFVVGVADLGKRVSVAVTGSRAGYTAATAVSESSEPVVAASGVAGEPTVTGAARVGSTLVAKAGAAWPKGTKLTYQWLADGTPIAKATKSSLVLGAAQLGKRVTIVMSGTRAGYEAVSATAPATATVTAGKLASSTPKVTGTVRVGKTVRIVAGSWTPGTQLSYSWYASGTKIAGASKSTFAITKKLLGKKITVKVTGKKAGYTSVVVKSAATKRVTR